METVQQRTAKRLLRRAVEAARPPPFDRRGLVDALVDRVLHALPSPRDATLVLKEEEAERELSGRRRFVDPWIRRLDPYQELFGFRRVVTSPWEEVWRRTPLVLHDVELLHALHFPPYLEAEPYDQVDNISKILANHPGPVDSLRVDSSVFPPPEILRGWMEMISAKEIKELVMLDVTTPQAGAPTVVEFPISHLRSSSLATLALGFVRIQFGDSSSSWFSGLEALTLTCCLFTGRELSTAIQTLTAIKNLKVLGCNLAAAGSGSVEVISYSLVSFEMAHCTASALTLRDAPKLCTLVAGVVVGDNGARRLLIDVSRADSLQDIRGLQLEDHVFFLSAAKDNCFYKRRRVLALLKVHNLELSLQMSLCNEATRLLELIAQLPGLQSLTVKRIDDCRPEEAESWYLLPQPLPVCRVPLGTCAWTATELEVPRLA